MNNRHQLTRYGMLLTVASALLCSSVTAQRFTTLKDFTTIDGAYPRGLSLSGGVLYGTGAGGISGQGMIFKMNIDGTSFVPIKEFSGSDESSGYLTLSGSVLYGATPSGGISNNGTLFRINTDGTKSTVLKRFIGGDGMEPTASLTSSGAVLYGATAYGGTWNLGTLFKVNANGTGFSILKHFAGSDGSQPSAGLALSGNTALALQAAPEVTGTYTNIAGANSPYTNLITEPKKFFRLMGN